jgi:hypothetical protein
MTIGRVSLVASSHQDASIPTRDIPTGPLPTTVFIMTLCPDVHPFLGGFHMLFGSVCEGESGQSFGCKQPRLANFFAVRLAVVTIEVGPV